MDELDMALVKVSGYIQAPGLFAREKRIPTPLLPRYQMNRTLREPRDGINFCLFRESNHDYLVLNPLFIL